MMINNLKIRRFGMVIGLREEHIAAYRKLHEGAGVRDLLKAANMRNFNLYLQKMPDGKYYEFGYYEYVGTDYNTDMKTLSESPRNIEWLRLCDPMQIPLPGQASWTEMESIYFNP